MSETRHFGGRGAVETLSFIWRPTRTDEPVGMHVALYDTDDLRGAVKADARGRMPRAGTEVLEALLAQDDRPPGSN